jgi:3',5'-cyclic AMP phosphodiesterase CpdA
MPQVSFLHISDLHISKYPELREIQHRSWLERLSAIRKGTYAASHSTGRLKALVELVYKLESRLDAVMITGDIATTGLTFDLEFALRFVEGVPDSNNKHRSNNFPTISGIQRPIFLLPGNHDRYKLLLGRFGYAPGGRNFHSLFHKHWGSDVKVNSLSNDAFSVGIIAADFSLRTARHSKLPQTVNMYSQGKVYQDTLDDLVSATNSYINAHIEESEVAIIWALHFPPLAPNLPSYMELLDSANLIAAANQTGVLFIISGHTHYPFELSSPREGFQLLGAGSVTQFDSSVGNHCQVITVGNAGEERWFEVEHYLFDYTSAEFIRV